MRAFRLLVYDGPQDWLNKTINLSLPVGTNIVGPGTITTHFLSDYEIEELDKANYEINNDGIPYFGTKVVEERK